MSDPLIGQLRVCADCAKDSPDNWTYLNEAARPVLRNAADEIERLRALSETYRQQAWADANEIARLRLENWQLKGALGYPVPGDIPCGDFKCGLCDARNRELSPHSETGAA